MRNVLARPRLKDPDNLDELIGYCVAVSNYRVIPHIPIACKARLEWIAGRLVELYDPSVIDNMDETTRMATVVFRKLVAEACVRYKRGSIQRDWAELFHALHANEDAIKQGRVVFFPKPERKKAAMTS